MLMGVRPKMTWITEHRGGMCSERNAKVTGLGIVTSKYEFTE